MDREYYIELGSGFQYGHWKTGIAWNKERPSDFLRKAREKYVKQNPISMKEIDDEIENYRSEKRG